MPGLAGLLEADGLSVQTALPPFSLGPKQAPLSQVSEFFKSHLTTDTGATGAAVVNLARRLPAATAFFQGPGRPRQLFGLAAAGASELLGSTSRGRKSGRSADTICLEPGKGCNSHEDFLFGGKLNDDTMSPQMAMMPWITAARATYRGDPSDEVAEDDGKGWSKVIPRSLGFFSVVDAASALVVFLTRNYVCDEHLRLWLMGGILLGGPTDALIKGIAWFLKPRYMYYKFQVVNCRDVTDAEFEIENLQLYDEFGREIDGFGVNAGKEGNCWMVSLKWPRMVSSYRIVTSRSLPAAHDPVTWQLYASNTKRTWRMIDEQDDGGVPMARDTPSELITDLRSLSEDASFRQAFLAELIATGISLGWLTIGSAWIARGSETCVDSAPELWYYCFLLAVCTWSCLGTVTIGLIVSAVAMILLGVKTP